MKKYILSLVIILGIAFDGQAVLAVDATISVSPSSATKTAGPPFLVNVQADPAGNKVCVIRGSLALGNLTCQSISVASGLMAQKAPTCANPSFTIGIPKCATSALDLFSVSVKGTEAGQASLAFSGVKAISISGNNAVDVLMTSQNGTYTISAAPTQKPVQPKIEEPATTETTEQPAIQQAEKTTQVVENIIPKEAGAASLATTMGNFFSKPITIIIAIIILILLAMWSFGGFLKKKKI